MAKKTKTAGGKKMFSAKRIIINIFAVIGLLAGTMVGGHANAEDHYRDNSPEQMAQHRAEKMTERFQLDNAKQAQVTRAWLKYFNSKKQAKDNLLADFKSTLSADQYKKIEEKMNRNHD